MSKAHVHLCVYHASKKNNGTVIYGAIPSELLINRTTMKSFSIDVQNYYCWCSNTNGTIDELLWAHHYDYYESVKNHCITWSWVALRSRVLLGVRPQTEEKEGRHQVCQQHLAFRSRNWLGWCFNKLFAIRISWSWRPVVAIQVVSIFTDDHRYWHMEYQEDGISWPGKIWWGWFLKP